MSKVTNGFEGKAFRTGDNGYIWRFQDISELLAHARALEDAIFVLLPIIKESHPKLDMSNFYKLLE